MDQVKIGKLIAMLRKEKGLTQGELGEIVGVSDGAVSKWERGTTCPDISIIHLLSKTLGITSDELLSGELSKETKSKLSRTKTLKTILPQIIIFLIIATISVFIIIKNSTNVYKLESIDSDNIVDGKIIFKINKMYIIINNIIFNDKDFNRIKINNYEYKIKCNNDIVFKTGNIDKENLMLNYVTIKEFSEKFKINYSDEMRINRQTIINEDLELKITFLTDDNKTISKTIKMKLVK